MRAWPGHEDQVGSDAGNPIQAFLAGGGLGDLETEGLEDAGEEFPVGLFVCRR